MKRMLVLSVAALAMPLFAQDKAAAAAPPAPRQVAIVNGEVITAERLDHLWNNMGVQMREQYEKTGGKPAFLENYLRKRLVIQEAIKTGFDKRPDVRVDMEAGSESALFDRYIRDIVAAPYVSEADIKKYFDEHRDEFPVPERVKLRHIVITETNAGPNPKTKGQALERIKQIAAELIGHNVELRKSEPGTLAQRRVIYFADAARKYSEDASASSGGDLGWHVKGDLDPAFEDAAWGMAKGTMSGVVETKFGYHLILVEDRQPAGTQSFDEVRSNIREFLLTQKASDVMTAVNKLTNELRMTSKVTLFPENIR